MNFGMIFLCLGIGCVVGFEFGRYVTGKKINEVLKNFAETLNKEAEKAQKKREELREKFNNATDALLQDIAKMEKEAQKKKAEQALFGKGADVDQKTIDEIYEIEKTESEAK